MKDNETKSTTPPTLEYNKEISMSFDTSMKIVSDTEMVMSIEWEGETYSVTIPKQASHDIMDIWYSDYMLQADCVSGSFESIRIFFDHTSKQWILPTSRENVKEEVLESDRDDLILILRYEGSCIDVCAIDEDGDVFSDVRYHADEWRVINKATLVGDILTIYQIDMIDYWNVTEATMTSVVEEICFEDDQVRYVRTISDAQKC